MVGSDMQRLKDSAAHLQTKLMDRFSKFAVRSDPMTFNEAGPERRTVMGLVRAKSGLFRTVGWDKETAIRWAGACGPS